MTMLDHPEATHLGDDEIPYVSAGNGVELKVLQVREAEGLWIIRNRFAPGVEVQKHRHTGPVYGYTTMGAWKYKEYDYVNRAGSFLYEPANSVHTLMVPEDNTEPTEVWFQMYGMNLNLDENGEVESVTDGPGVLQAYFMMCEAAGLDRPNVLTD